jgi:DNA-binding XRE family transcriptional regulator
MLQRKSKPTVLNGLRDARLSRGLTEIQLATMAGCEPTTIAAIEEGEYAPSISLSLRLAWALGYPVEQLFWLLPPSPKLHGRPERGDERTQAISSLSTLVGLGFMTNILIAYLVIRTLFSVPKVTMPQYAIFCLFFLTVFVAQFYAYERRAKKPFDTFWLPRRVFYSGGTLFYLAGLGSAIGLTGLQIVAALIGITAIPIWALAIREFVRNRHSVQYHESYGDG